VTHARTVPADRCHGNPGHHPEDHSYGEDDDRGDVDDGQSDRLVLTGRPLNGGAHLEETARFGQDAWDLSPAMFQRQTRAVSLNFTPFPQPYRLTVKQLCLAMLSGPLPPNEPRPSVLSIRRHLVEWKRFTLWLDARSPRPGRRLQELTVDDIAAYGQHLTSALGSPASQETAQVAVRFFWRYRSVLPGDRLVVDPLDADGWGNSSGRARGENTTTRIPEQIMGPLLKWCLRFIDDFAPDIIAARTRWHASRHRSRLGRLTAAQVESHLRAVLDTYLSSGRALPGHKGKVNYRALAREVGCSPNALTVASNKAAVDAVADRNGVNFSPALDIPITARVDEQPWLLHVGIALDDPYGAVPLAILLQSACYITIAYLSGMRDSEIKHLRRGCVHVHRDSTGKPYRWTITSRAFKGEVDPTGTAATWVIGAAAARAVEVLGRLQPPDADVLFRSVAATMRDPQLRRAQNVGRTNQMLNVFVSWVNTYCHDHGRTDTIPEMAGTDRLQTRQFRRTLAWHIARRPGGAIAGAIQYRHLSVQMFEGYAGTSESGFRAEVEAELALSRGEHLLAMTTGYDHSTLTGPAAGEGARRLEDFTQRAGLTATRFAGTVVADPERLTRLMKRRDPHIYPGTYTTCVFDPAKAMCQPRPDSHGTSRPIQSRCQPLDCRNTALTPHNRDSLQEEAARIDTELAQRPLLPPLLAHQLTARRDKITAFLASHDTLDTP
jgi:hypothetical protein